MKSWKGKIGQLFLFILILIPLTENAQIIFEDSSKNLAVHKNLIYFIEDKGNQLGILEIARSKNFKLLSGSGNVPNFGITNSSIWLKLNVINRTAFNPLLLKLNQPTVDEVQFYSYDPVRRKYEVRVLGEFQNFFMRDYATPEYLFDLAIPKDSLRTFYLRIRCKENMQIPLVIGSRITFFNNAVSYNLASGIYIGIMLVMILYNLFIYSTIKDKSYIIYSLYIVLILLTQTSIQGYTFQYLWPNYPPLAEYSQFIFPVAVGLIGLEFFKEFLRLKERFRKTYLFSFVFIVPYCISLVMSFSGHFALGFKLVEITAGMVSLFMLSVALITYRKGFSEARFFLIGWSVFLLGICIFVMKDFEVLPYNNFTRYTMHFGSAAEVILLSFALADRINILKKEKEESQAEALEVSKQNQELITQQNIILEQKVHERTLELEETNVELNTTLNQLKDAQIQLVDAEKMASLGQLTAGIAHEINNPINFVLANIKPLRMDVSELMELIDKYELIQPNELNAAHFKEIENFKRKIDLNYMKEEIEKIVHGIDDGARRTAEIVSGLKNFSRLDEYDIKEANINDGIESTLILLRSTIAKEIEVRKELGAIPMIECYPGKLNQVFMNILSNSIYALDKKTTSEKKQLRVSTYENGDQVIVEFADTGIGMSKEAKDKIFEPFFTTKDVGEGTGLGMSIVFKIIESHQAKMEIESQIGVGTKITLVLNKKIKK